MTSLPPFLRASIRRDWPWVVTAIVAMIAAGLLFLWFTPMQWMNLSINPDALLPQNDPVGEAASAAHQHPPACEEPRIAPEARRSDGTGARR